MVSRWWLSTSSAPPSTGTAGCHANFARRGIGSDQVLMTAAHQWVWTGRTKQACEPHSSAGPPSTGPGQESGVRSRQSPSNDFRVLASQHWLQGLSDPPSRWSQAHRRYARTCATFGNRVPDRGGVTHVCYALMATCMCRCQTRTKSPSSKPTATPSAPARVVGSMALTRAAA